jgi:molybdate transport system permease protein
MVSWRWKNNQPVAMSGETWQIAWFTLWVAALSSVLIFPFGVALAWLLARRDWPGKSVVETLVALPLVVPPVATGLLLLKLFGRRGPFGSLLENTLGWEIVFTWRAVLLATALMSFPLLVRTARVAFESVSPRLEQVARTLGASDWRVFVTVSLPLAAHGLVAGTVLAFARALGEFGATIMVAGYIPGKTATLSLSIYHLVQLGRDSEALGLLVISLVLAFGAVWLSEWFLRRRAS